jgi:two-component system cell cycle sensor histidine kinase/response regulator CckA
MTDPTATPEPVTPARRLGLLRAILGGEHSAADGPSGEAQPPSPPALSSLHRPGDDGGPDAAAASRHILVVDDEQVVLTLTGRMLRDGGYGVLEALSAREALRLLERRDPPVDLVITDVVMPETDGRMLGLLIAKRYPQLPVVYMSAYSMNDIFHRGSPGPDLPFLSKPFSPEALLALVKTVLI